MKKYLIIFFSCILFIKQSYAQDNKKEIVLPTCTVKFEFNQDKVDETSLNNCIKQIDMKNMIYIDVFTTSSPEGGLAYNYKLSERRALNIKKLLSHFNVPINIKNGGSNPKFGKQGTIIFLVHNFNEKLITCSETKPVPEKCVNKLVEQPIIIKQDFNINPKPDLRSNDEIYGGAGETFISLKPLSDYVGSHMMTYNLGLIHKLIPMALFNGTSNFYIGGEVSFAHSQRTLSQVTSGSSVVSQQSDVRYVRNNFSFVLGVDRNFSSLKPLSAFLEIGPALQERVFVLSLSGGPTQNGYVSRDLGLISNLGFKYKFLEQSSSLSQLGIDNLFARLSFNTSYGPKMHTDELAYKTQPEAIDINEFSWGTILGLGLSY